MSESCSSKAIVRKQTNKHASTDFYHPCLSFALYVINQSIYELMLY